MCLQWSALAQICDDVTGVLKCAPATGQRLSVCVCVHFSLVIKVRAQLEAACGQPGERNSCREPCRDQIQIGREKKKTSVAVTQRRSERNPGVLCGPSGSRDAARSPVRCFVSVQPPPTQCPRPADSRADSARGIQRCRSGNLEAAAGGGQGLCRWLFAFTLESYEPWKGLAATPLGLRTAERKTKHTESVKHSESEITK